MQRLVAFLVGGLAMGGVMYALSGRKKRTSLPFGSIKHPPRGIAEREAIEAELESWGMRSLSYEEACRVRRSCSPPNIDQRAYTAIVRSILRKRNDPMHKADGRLLSVGYNHVPPAEWATPEAPRSLHRFYSFWGDTQGKPNVVGSCYNACPETAFEMWARLGYPYASPKGTQHIFQMSAPYWHDLLPLMRRASRKIPLMRFFTSADVITRKTIPIGDRLRLLKAPPEIRWIVRRGLSDIGEIDSAFSSVIIRDDGSYKVNWEEVARLLRNKDVVDRATPKRALWWKYHKRIPKDPTSPLLSLTPEAIRKFDKKTYMAIFKFLRDYGVPERDAISGAVRMAFTFGKRWKNVVDAVAARHSRRHMDAYILHDMTYWLPNEPAEKFGDLLLRHKVSLTRPSDTFLRLAREWKTVSRLIEKTGVEDPEDLISMLNRGEFEYTDKKLASEYAKWGRDRKTYRKLESRWLSRSEELKEEKRKAIPYVEVKHGGYTFTRLDPDDPRTLFLGEYTYCCQSIGGAAESCVWHGVESPNSGFYVVLDRKGDIVAQSWAWRKGDVLVFDNVEGIGRMLPI